MRVSGRQDREREREREREFLAVCAFVREVERKAGLCSAV